MQADEGEAFAHGVCGLDMSMWAQIGTRGGILVMNGNERERKVGDGGDQGYTARTNGPNASVAAEHENVL
jgi:hypothetical protein